MDSGNIVDKNEELEQPEDAVVADAEENGSPQTVDSDSELFIETEDDQQQTSKAMSSEQQRAAFLEERRKRKKKNEELQKEREEKQRLADELAELRAQVSSVTNPKPNPSDFYNAEEYAEALTKWQNSKQPVKSNNEAAVVDQGIDDQSAYELFAAEEAVKNSLPDYEEAKSKVAETLKQNNMADTELAFAAINRLSRFTGADPAKAIYAFSKTPALMQELLNASTVNDGGATASKVVKRAADKVKARKKVVIDSQPEPDIKSSGPIDNLNKELEKARENWATKKDTMSFRKVQEIKTRMKAANQK